MDRTQSELDKEGQGPGGKGSVSWSSSCSGEGWSPHVAMSAGRQLVKRLGFGARHLCFLT